MLPVRACAGAVLLAAPMLAAQTEPRRPEDWGPPGRAHVTVTVEEREFAGRIRLAYTVRYMADADGRWSWAPIVRVVIGARPDSAQGELTAMPLGIVSPPGWEAKAIPDGPPETRRWRISWSCTKSASLKPNEVLTGFGFTVPLARGNPAEASYAVYTDASPGLGAAGPEGSIGTPFRTRTRTRP